MGSGNIKGFDAANIAKVMFGGVGIECVGSQVVVALDQPESAGWDNQVQVSGFAADRAIAFVDCQCTRRIHFKTNLTTMKNLLMFHHILRFILISRGFCEAGVPARRALLKGLLCTIGL
jgi:hypothetical protein